MTPDQGGWFGQGCEEVSWPENHIHHEPKQKWFLVWLNPQSHKSTCYRHRQYTTKKLQRQNMDTKNWFPPKIARNRFERGFVQMTMLSFGPPFHSLTSSIIHLTLSGSRLMNYSLGPSPTRYNIVNFICNIM